MKSSNKKDQDNETILKKKTNQDFNNQKPDPKSPNLLVNHQIGEKEEEEQKKKEVISESDNIGSEHKTNQQKGDELNNGKDANPMNFEEENKNVDNDQNTGAEYIGNIENQNSGNERD